MSKSRKMDKLDKCYIWHIVTLAKMKLLSKVSEKKMREASIEQIQGYFDAIDTNKWLLFNAMNNEQAEKARKFERHVMNVINDLIAPLPID